MIAWQNRTGDWDPVVQVLSQIYCRWWVSIGTRQGSLLLLVPEVWTCGARPRQYQWSLSWMLWNNRRYLVLHSYYPTTYHMLGVWWECVNSSLAAWGFLSFCVILCRVFMYIHLNITTKTFQWKILEWIQDVTLSHHKFLCSSPLKILPPNLL
jgi:hypothetical protein